MDAQNNKEKSLPFTLDHFNMTEDFAVVSNEYAEETFEDVFIPDGCDGENECEELNDAEEESEDEGKGREMEESVFFDPREVSPSLSPNPIEEGDLSPPVDDFLSRSVWFLPPRLPLPECQIHHLNPVNGLIGKYWYGYGGSRKKRHEVFLSNKIFPKQAPVVAPDTFKMPILKPVVVKKKTPSPKKATRAYKPRGPKKGKATRKTKKTKSTPRRRKNSKDDEDEGAQKICCIIGCAKKVQNRLRFSLRCHCEKDFKKDFLGKSHDKVCHYHYFSDLYQHKKLMKAKESGGIAKVKTRRK